MPALYPRPTTATDVCGSGEVTQMMMCNRFAPRGFQRGFEVGIGKAFVVKMASTTTLHK
jgi:hypothetical protein